MIVPKNPNIRYESYDFIGIRATEGVFGIHKYPAMLHFKLVEELVREFFVEGTLIYDPFCGSGTTLNVAVRMGRPAIGTDINPIGLLIAKVRSYTDIKPEMGVKRLLKEWDKLPSDVPRVRNVFYWFKPETVKDLGKLRAFLRSMPEGREREFFLVVFSQTVREVSLTRKGEFKRYRMPADRVEGFNPDVLNTFLNTARDYLLRLRSSPKPKATLRVYLHDVRRPLPFNESVGMVITSPPYGDSRTTVAYGEFFSFSMEWMKGLIEIPELRLDRFSLGGRVSRSYAYPPSPTLKSTVRAIAKVDKRRAREVLTFYQEFFLSLSNITQRLSDGGTACFVVGNRRVKGHTVPMDRIVVEMLTHLGLEHYETRVRRISNKRMPLKNSPTNVKGKTDRTMGEEYIVIMRKLYG